MFTVQQVIDLAKNGPIKQLGLKTDDTVVLGYVNMGILELYKRFQLKVEEYVIDLVDAQTIYTMPDDYMWIVAAYGEVAEDSTEYVNVLPINKEDDPESVNTIGYNQVQVPLAVTGSYISIMYVASPEFYTDTELDNKLALPPQMVDALLEYVGAKGYSSISSNPQSEGNVYLQRFEMMCKDIKSKGMFNQDDLYMSDRVKDRGFI